MATATDPVQVHMSSDFPVKVPLSVAEIRRLFFHYKRECALTSHFQL